MSFHITSNNYFSVINLIPIVCIEEFTDILMFVLYELNTNLIYENKYICITYIKYKLYKT